MEAVQTLGRHVALVLIATGSQDGYAEGPGINRLLKKQDIMDQSTFDRLATALLERFFDRIDADLGDDIDVDYEAGILTLKFADGRTYLLNKHAPNREIWLSSPVSGAWHFAYVAADDVWRSTRPVAQGPDDLVAMLQAELAALTGGAVDLIE